MAVPRIRWPGDASRSVTELDETWVEPAGLLLPLPPGGPRSFALADYTGVVAVTPAGPRCCLKFGYTATLVGVDEASWGESWLAIEHQVFEFIRRQI